MLIDMLKDVEQKAGVTPPPEPAPFTAADEEVIATFIARLRQAWEEELRQKATENAGSSLERLRPPTSSLENIRHLAAARLHQLRAALLPRAEPADPIRDELRRDHRGEN